MKKVLLTLLALVVVVGILAGAGFAGYSFGYRQGVLAASKGDTTTLPFGRGNDFNLKRMPMHNFGYGPDRGFHPGFGPGGFRKMPYGRGFGFFSPVRFVVQLAILGLIVWLVYKLLTGWRLTFTRTTRTPESPRTEAVPPAKSETQNTEEQSS